MATVDTTTGTYLSDLFNPQVIGQMISEKLVPNIVFAPLARVDYTLQGRPGNTITLPYFNYAGDAVDVAEGEDIPINKLTELTKQVTVQKVATGFQLTYEAVASGYGDPINEAVNQITTGIASAIDNKLLEALNGNTKNVYIPSSTLTVDDIPKALALYGEDMGGRKSIIVDPDFYAELLHVKSWVPASEIAANLLINGAVGMAYGTQVIVSERVKDSAFHIVKPDALALYMKWDTFVETDKDIVNQSYVITGSKNVAPYLYKPSAAVKIARS